MPPDPREITIVGSGRMGVALAVALSETAPFPEVCLVGRREARPETLGDESEISYSVETSPARGGTLILCVPDDHLPAVARTWADRISDGEQAVFDVALHTSGVRPAEILAALRGPATAVASWHPLVALSAPRADAFAGVTFGVEGDVGAVSRGRWLASALGAKTVDVDAERKVLYHLAAVYGSNLLVACMATAERLLADSLAKPCRDGGAADEPGDLVGHLLPLARSAIEAVGRAGLVRGATGPVVRGDVGTITDHLDALDPDARTLYRLLSVELLRLREDALPEAVRVRLRDLLDPQEGEGRGEDGD